jgi:uncharacterized membrane protein YedE/YeeE
MKQNIVALISGILFGFGLGLSQMVDRERVLGFLDVTGNWDPTLLFVLGGAVGVTIISFRFVLGLAHPIFEKKFFLPTKKELDFPLVLGAGIFGIGWGITGYCPGPAITSLVQGVLNPVIFLIALIIGSFSYKLLTNKQPQEKVN